MRVTSNIFPEEFKSDIHRLRAREIDIQRKIATGLEISQSSEAPIQFAKIQSATTSVAQRNAFLESNAEADEIGQFNYDAMADFAKVMTRASEVTIRANHIYTDQDLEALAQEIDGLISQTVSIANRQKDGRYLFGGTANERPIDPTTLVYNTNTNSNLTTAKIDEGLVVDTGLVAGRPGSYDGFLSDGTIDVIDTLVQVRNRLQSGSPADVDFIQGTLLGQVNQAVDLAGEFVGRAAARLHVHESTRDSLSRGVQTDTIRAAELTDVNLSDAISDLNSIQLSFQAALQSGARILNLSLMDYIR